MGLKVLFTIRLCCQLSKNDMFTLITAKSSGMDLKSKSYNSFVCDISNKMLLAAITSYSKLLQYLFFYSASVFYFFST